MKILSLIIKQSFFDQIVDGSKKEEYREVKPTTIKRLLQLDKDGYEIEDEYGNSLPIKYDAIRFYVGYNKDRDTCLVEVKNAYCQIFVDEDDQPIMYEFGTDPKTGEPLEWVAEQVVYELGKILEVKKK